MKTMNTYINWVFTIILIQYLIFSFIKAEFDFTLWEECSRQIFGKIAMFISFLFIILAPIIKEFEDEE